MDTKGEFKFLVVVGAWNRNIFTENWIKKFLLPEDDFTLEISLGSAQAHRVSTDKIRIEFENNKINLIPIQFSIKICEYLIELAVKLSEYLPHTPATGYGINFIFHEDSNTINSELIKICDKDQLISKDIEYIDSQYTHVFKFSEIGKATVKLTVTPAKDKTIFDFNLHTKINDLVEFKESILNIKISEIYTSITNLLSDVYDISLKG